MSEKELLNSVIVNDQFYYETGRKTRKLGFVYMLVDFR